MTRRANHLQEAKRQSLEIINAAANSSSQDIDDEAESGLLPHVDTYLPDVFMPGYSAVEFKVPLNAICKKVGMSADYKDFLLYDILGEAFKRAVTQLYPKRGYKPDADVRFSPLDKSTNNIRNSADCTELPGLGTREPSRYFVHVKLLLKNEHTEEIDNPNDWDEPKRKIRVIKPDRYEKIVLPLLNSFFECSKSAVNDIFGELSNSENWLWVKANNDNDQRSEGLIYTGNTPNLQSFPIFKQDAEEQVVATRDIEHSMREPVGENFLGVRKLTLPLHEFDSLSHTENYKPEDYFEVLVPKTNVRDVLRNLISSEHGKKHGLG